MDQRSGQEKLGYMRVNFRFRTPEMGITHGNLRFSRCCWEDRPVQDRYNRVSILVGERKGRGHFDKDSFNFFLSDPPLWVWSSGCRFEALGVEFMKPVERGKGWGT